MAHEPMIRKPKSVSEELEQMHKRIMQRAYEIFEDSGRFFGRDIEHWLAAEGELVWRPAIELKEQDNAFVVRVAVPGMEAKDLDVEVTPDELLVKAEAKHEHEEKKGKVHTCEFQAGSLFRSISFPRPIDPDKVKTELKDGVLTVTAEAAEKRQAKKVKIAA